MHNELPHIIININIIIIIIIVIIIKQKCNLTLEKLLQNNRSNEVL